VVLYLHSSICLHDMVLNEAPRTIVPLPLSPYILKCTFKVNNDKSHLTWNLPRQHAAAAVGNELLVTMQNSRSHASRWVPGYVGLSVVAHKAMKPP
jgi:hypothetical protein